MSANPRNEELCKNLLPNYVKIFNSQLGWLHYPAEEIVDIKNSSNTECLVIYKKGDQGIYPHTNVAHLCPHFSNF